MKVLTISERVSAGAAWLDEHKPGWERVVNLNTLEMANTCRCVLGQLFQTEAVDYPGCDLTSDGEWSAFYYVTNNLETEDYWAQDNGFDTSYVVSEFELLSEAWTDLIKMRHDTGTLSDMGCE